VTGKQKMTPSEAFVETLVAQGVKDVFGIVGSAYMDALDLFPLAGIRFISVAHEQGGGHMADGYSRVSGATASASRRTVPASPISSRRRPPRTGRIRPVVVVTPETGSMHARPRRLPGDRAASDLLEDHEVPGARQQRSAHGRAHGPRVRSRAASRWAVAAQHPRDFFYGDIECEIPRPIVIERGAGGAAQPRGGRRSFSKARVSR
jgi:sulfoacetaldehyde acetyltransferase